MRCVWCHNPESLTCEPQVSIDSTRCLDCGSCLEACPLAGGPNPVGPVLPDHDCTLCGSCVGACPSGAREIVGSLISVEDLLENLLRDRIFYDESGGGVTFSGGEPLAQPAFLKAALGSCAEEGIHTAIDTCGYCETAELLEIAELADLFLFDLKAVDSALHERLTGVPVEPILTNLEALAGTGQAIWLRIPVIPGLTDRAETVNSAVRLADKFPNISKISLLPYHRTGTGKLARLGEGATSLRIESPSDELLRQLAKPGASSDVTITIGG